MRLRRLIRPDQKRKRGVRAVVEEPAGAEIIDLDEARVRLRGAGS